MGKQGRKAYLDAIWQRYRDAARRDKGIILDEFCSVCGYHRKHATSILNARIRQEALPRCVLRERPKRKRGRPGRRPTYHGAPFLAALERVWVASGHPCGKRLRALMPAWVPHMGLTAGVSASLLGASASTLERLLEPVRQRMGYKGLSGTRPGSLLRHEIPIRTGNWDITRPGFVEADTVAHCGGSLEGSFVWSLTLTDILTGWTENRAVWNKGAHGVVEAVRDIEGDLPFALLGFDCDNGSEFLNHHLVGYFAGHPGKPGLTRSRPYHKNDNAHVEGKNWTHVRKLLGYGRLGSPELLGPINELYREWGLLQNYFMPNAKLKEKTRVGAKYRRVHEAPTTPCEKCLASEHVDEGTKRWLRETREELDPFELKANIDGILSRIAESNRVRIILG